MKKTVKKNVLLTTKHAQCVIYFVLRLNLPVADRDFVANNFIVAY